MPDEYTNDTPTTPAGGGYEPPRPERPLALYGIIAVLAGIIIILLARSCVDDPDTGGTGSTPTPETIEVTRLITDVVTGPEVEVTRLITVEVPGPPTIVTTVITREVPGPPTIVTTVVTREVPGPEVEVTRVVTEPGTETEVTRIVTRVVVLTPPTPSPTGDGCTRFNMEVGRNRDTGAPLAGTYVMVQQPFDRDDNVVTAWSAGVGALDSGWLRNLPLADEVVYVQVHFYPEPYGTPIVLEIVNPAPDTPYGWLANGVCHAIEIQFPAGS